MSTRVGTTAGGGEASPWSPEELIPFGKYLLLDRISVGATAALYRAKIQGEAGFEKIVAVKRILPQMAGDPEFVETFVREAKIAAQLSHTNICPIYELGKVGESLYMSMEYVSGRDLGCIHRQLMARGEPMDSVMAAWLASRLCEALDYAHSLKDPQGRGAGLVHRDLSPSNILVSYEGQVKLIDFGLARASGRATQTNVDALKKKLGYMSPEMVKGRPVDHRSDIFGVGICLYEMVTQRRLFQGKDEISTLQLLGTASFPPPSAVCEDPPEELELIIMRALERDPEDRWETAGEMNEALQGYIHSRRPTYGARQLSQWMQETFRSEMEREQQRLRTLLKASDEPGLIEARRHYFSSRAGAAAAAHSERTTRNSQRPAPMPARPAQGRGRVPLPQRPSLPAPPPPRLAEAEARKLAESFDLHDPQRGGTERLEPTPIGAQALDPTAFRPDKLGGADAAFADEATTFYDDRSAGIVQTTFGDEPTKCYDPEGVTGDTEGDEDSEATAFYDRADLSAPEPATGAPASTWDEDATQIYFSTEEGVGLEDLPNALYGSLPPPAPPPAGPSVAGGPRRSTWPAPALVSQPPRGAYHALASPNPAAPDRSRTAQGGHGIPHVSTMRWSGATQRIPTVRPTSARWPAWFVGSALALFVGAGAAVTLSVLTSPPVGAVEVRATPEIQAVVLLDGVHRGRTPLRIEKVQVGLRTLEVRATGYENVVRALHVKEGATANLEVTLERQSGTSPLPADTPSPNKLFPDDLTPDDAHPTGLP